MTTTYSNNTKCVNYRGITTTALTVAYTVLNNICNHKNQSNHKQGTYWRVLNLSRGMVFPQPLATFLKHCIKVELSIISLRKYVSRHKRMTLDLYPELNHYRLRFRGKQRKIKKYIRSMANPDKNVHKKQQGKLRKNGKYMSLVLNADKTLCTKV